MGDDDDLVMTISDMSARLGLCSKGHRALRLAASKGAFGPITATHARAAFYPENPALYRAVLFMTLHNRVGMPAEAAADLVAHVDDEQLADAIAATLRGERWAFDLQHVARDVRPIAGFRPWDQPRWGTGAEASGPPIARTIVDCYQIWGWIDPPAADDDLGDLL